MEISELTLLSLLMGWIIGPLGIWLGWKGIMLKLMAYRAKKSGNEVMLYVDKSNNLDLILKKRDGSRIRDGDASYISTPEAEKVYRFWNMSVRIRRENDPEDIDIWERPNISGQTAKELDNVVNEAESNGLANMLKQYFPIVIILTMVVVVMAVAGLFMNLSIYYNIEDLAPALVDFVPEALRP